MPSSSIDSTGPEDILQQLTALPHRGVGTEEIEKAAELIKGTLKKIGASVESQPLLCPKTYLPLVWWLVGGIVLGLILAGYQPWAGFGVTALFALLGLAHFDWRSTPLPYLVPRVKAENIIARRRLNEGQKSKVQNKLILMAHYDSAPISYIYRSSMVAGFHRSLLISIGLMLLAPVLVFIEAISMPWSVLKWLRYGLIFYFLFQITLSSIDYFRYGFSNGAADNATGVAVAVAAARRLWEKPEHNWDVELVLTSGEEIAMIGAREYFKKYRSSWIYVKVYLLNFDNLGSGTLKIITKTGSISPVRYDNPLSEAAVNAVQRDSRFTGIGTANWHTGDFDSIWFERAGIPSLTLSAQDENGLIPYLHRPGDTLENVDLSLLPLATDFAVAVLESLRNNAPDIS